MQNVSGAFTGDQTNMTMYIVLAALAIACLLIVIFLKRRKKEK